MGGLLYKTEHQINEHISIRIPTIREIIADEDSYFNDVGLIVSTPYDMMVSLDDIHVDFTTIDDWELFCLLFDQLRQKDLSLIFSNINLSTFEPAVNNKNGELVFIDRKTRAVIDRGIHWQICAFIRKILCISRTSKQPANEEARVYMIERARTKMRRHKNDKPESQLEEYIVALVNASEFPYNYESVQDLTIYQFNSSLHQVINRVNYDKMMIGCYAGTVAMKEIDPDDLCWLTPKKTKRITQEE